MKKYLGLIMVVAGVAILVVAIIFIFDKEESTPNPTPTPTTAPTSTPTSTPILEEITLGSYV